MTMGSKPLADQTGLDTGLKMAGAISGIPVVDFTALSIKNITRPSANNSDVQALAKKIYHAFSTVGFVYLVNHGISEDEVSLCSF